MAIFSRAIPLCTNLSANAFRLALSSGGLKGLSRIGVGSYRKVQGSMSRDERGQLRASRGKPKSGMISDTLQLGTEPVQRW